MRFALLSAIFLAGYAGAYEAMNWISVYVFDQWDPKFGPAGTIRLGHELLPLFLAVALAVWAIAAAPNRAWLRAAPRRTAILAHLAGGSMSAVSQLLGDAIPVEYLGLAFYLVVPALLVLLMFRFLGRRSNLP